LGLDVGHEELALGVKDDPLDNVILLDIALSEGNHSNAVHPVIHRLERASWALLLKCIV
jgi:hypothetical protein